MKHKKSIYAKCKCCGFIKDKSDVSISLSILKNADAIKSSGQQYDLYEWLIDVNFEWACDQCINDKRALVANPSQQNNAYTSYLSYFDTNLVCKKCKNGFIFTKDEKKLWYEKLKFYRESVPLHCLKCRKEVRKLKLQNKILSEVLKKYIKDITIDELSQIIQIYDEWKIEDKFNFYRKVKDKRLK